MKITKTYLENYDIGVEYKKIYDNLDDALYNFMSEYEADHLDSTFFRLGYEGKKRPVKATGWRYGKFSDYGISRNHQSGKCEKSLSLMEVYVDGILKDKASTASALFLRDKEKYQVSGYWTLDIWGSDGEPLMLAAKNIK